MATRKAPRKADKEPKDDPLKKPYSVERNETRSEIWDETVSLRKFSTSQIPLLALYCQWRARVEELMEMIDFGIPDDEEINLDVELKRASSEIRALTKQLGLNEKTTEVTLYKVKETPLDVLKKDRANRKPGSAHKKRA